VNYSPEQQDNVFDENQERLNRDITICQKVKETVDSAGWKEIISPILDKMIIDILGGKIKEHWLSGKVDRARSEEKREFYIGVKQGLIDFHNRVMNHIRQLPILEEQLKVLKQDRDKGYRVPMEDTRYNPEG
jgi:hypothetical protein